MRPAQALAGAAAPVTIEATGALCAVGRGIAQVQASVRAGISRQAASSVHDRRFEPLRMALVPEEALEPLAAPLEGRGLTARLRRMLRLAAPALREAAAGLPDGEAPPPLFLGLPEPRPHAPEQAQVDVVAALVEQSGVEVDRAASQVFPRGRAAALLALEAAVRFLRRGGGGGGRVAIAGGVDTYLDLALLGELDLEQRILGDTVADGFIPGEGAAFVVLRAAARGAGGRAEGGAGGQGRAAVAVSGVGTAQDPGHRYGSEPARGEGLAHAMDDMLARLRAPPHPIQITWAGFNGESFGAKEWGVAHLRHRDLFVEGARIEHPADCYGDAGAATGALLLAIAHGTLVRGLVRGNVPGSALVFASSDREDRACALLDLLA